MAQMRLCTYCARQYAAASTEGELWRRPQMPSRSRTRAASTFARRHVGEICTRVTHALVQCTVQAA
eukprot:6324304-Alexandrium_andersonii.AAC.1